MVDLVRGFGINKYPSQKEGFVIFGQVFKVVIGQEISYFSPSGLEWFRRHIDAFEIIIDIPLVTIFANNKLCPVGVNTEEFYVLYHLLINFGNSWTADTLRKIIEEYRGKPINTDISKIVNRLKKKTHGVLNNKLIGISGRYRIEGQLKFAIIVGSCSEVPELAI